MEQRIVSCIKLKKDLPGLDKPPFKGEIGQRIYDQVSKQAWDSWRNDMQMKVLNEYRLNMGDPKDYQVLVDQMLLFLNLKDGEAAEVENAERDEMGEEKHPRIAIVGAGNMGAAFANGIIHGHVTTPSNLILIEANSDRRSSLESSLGCRVIADIGGVTGADLVLLAVKPQEIRNISSALVAELVPTQLVLSCLAGCSLSTLSELLGGHELLVRCMPNLPVQIGEGMTVYIGTSSVQEAHYALVESILTQCGKFIRINEDLLDSATALSGSGTGYVAYFMENMVVGGEALGFTREEAILMVEQTLLGAALYMRSSGRSPSELRAMVTSPNGTTAAAIEELNRGGVGVHIVKALECAYERSKELGRSLK